MGDPKAQEMITDSALSCIISAIDFMAAEVYDKFIDITLSFLFNQPV